MNAIKRLNPVTKKAPMAVELLKWIYENFIDPNSLADLQHWASLMIGFFFCLRISEIEELRENDLVFQSTQDVNARTVRIRKSKSDQEGQGALRSLLPTGSVLCPPSACIDWMRIRGWDSEADSPLFPKIRSRAVGC